MPLSFWSFFHRSPFYQDTPKVQNGAKNTRATNTGVNWPPRNFLLSHAAFDLGRPFFALLDVRHSNWHHGSRRNSLWHWMDSRLRRAELGVSRCEFMGSGHPLSKVYLRGPWRTDFFLVAVALAHLLPCLGSIVLDLSVTEIDPPDCLKLHDRSQANLRRGCRLSGEIWKHEPRQYPFF